jgi:ornithine cyclodeaminase/alanine dehydrogenase-like protein (mu-crystallin family)
MIFLTNQHLQAVLDMRSCIQAMETAYGELAQGTAGYRPRIDFYVPQEPHYYRWGTMEGVSRALGVFAIRMKSDLRVWNREGAVQPEEKYCLQPGTYCGLIFLLSVRNGEPLALMNDGYLQHLRVGACAGLGAKFLSRPDSRVLGVLGSGGMARTYTEAICQVRPIRRVQVFSPTYSHRELFAHEMAEKLGVEAVAADAPEKAVRGADIVALTTDSLVPVIKGEWIQPGVHLTNVRSNEVGPDALARADVLASLGQATLVSERMPPGTIRGSDGMFAYFAGTEQEKGRVPQAPLRVTDDPRVGTLPDLMAGRWPGRTDPRQVTFLNNQGTQGLQFAAVAGAAYQRAKERGLGHPLPLEWFLQDIRD